MVSEKLRNAYLYRRRAGVPAAMAIEWARRDDKPRYPRPVRPTFGVWSEDRQRFFCDDLPFRHVGRTDEVAKAHGGWRDLRDTRGYYTDDDGVTGTMEGHVLQLSARDGRPCYIAAIRHTEWDGVTIFPGELWNDPLECAVAALSEAERAADQERDYQRAWQAGNEAAECKRISDNCRKQIRQVIGDLRTARRHIHFPEGDGSIRQQAIRRLCDIARGKVSDLLREMYRARERRNELCDDYGSIDAFEDGYNG